jgi:cytochrome oxidase Cu insertion factor (SCO1/SenC/PrrC family)
MIQQRIDFLFLRSALKKARHGPAHVFRVVEISMDPQQTMQ